MNSERRNHNFVPPTPGEDDWLDMSAPVLPPTPIDISRQPTIPLSRLEAIEQPFNPKFDMKRYGGWTPSEVVNPNVVVPNIPEPPTTFDALKGSIQKRDKNGDKSPDYVTRIELPNGRYLPTRRIRKPKHNIRLLEISDVVEEYPEAMIRKKDGSSGYAAEILGQDAASNLEASARMRRTEANRRERIHIAELSSAPARYKHDLRRLLAQNTTEVRQATNAFNASELAVANRTAPILAVEAAVESGAAALRQALDQHAENIRDRISSMRRIAIRALQPHETEAVEHAQDYIDRVAAQIQAKRHQRFGLGYRWTGKGIEAALHEILPHGEPYTNERNLLVRVALNEHLLEMARGYTQNGDVKQAHEMLNYFQHIGIIHRHARQAMDIVIDQEHSLAVANSQLERINPGSSDLSYINGSGILRKKTVRLPRNAKRFSSNESYSATCVIVDAVAIQQVHYIQNHSADPDREMDDTMDNVRAVLSSMNDSHAAEALNIFISWPENEPEQGTDQNIGPLNGSIKHVEFQLPTNHTASSSEPTPLLVPPPPALSRRKKIMGIIPRSRRAQRH